VIYARVVVVDDLAVGRVPNQFAQDGPNARRTATLKVSPYRYQAVVDSTDITALSERM